MPYVASYPTLTELWHSEMMRQLFATKKELDFIASIDTVRYNCFLSCDSMSFKFDAGRDLWLTKARFTVLQREYLDLEILDSFLDRCETIGLGESKRGVITGMPMKPVTIRSKKHRWGACMMGITYRGGGKYGQPTLTLHSRVSYIAYIGGLDLALCHVLAREIGERIGVKPKDFAFNWVLDSSQFHFFKSIPALFGHNIEPIILDEGEYPSTKHPTLKGVRKWWRGAIEKYENEVPLSAEKYGPLKRIRRRYEEFKNEDFLPPVPIKSLTFDPLRKRG